MFWNKKETKSSLPDLPPMNSVPGRDFTPELEIQDAEEAHGLPSFPDSPMKKGFSQAAIKDAVSNRDSEEELVGPTEIKNIKIVEMDEDSEPKISPVIPARPSKLLPAPVISEPVISDSIIPDPSPVQPVKFETRGSDIFVKMEKFYSAKRALSSTQDQLNSIESVLKRIRETKLREEQELSAWEKEIMQAKARIQEVTKNIFEKT